MLRVNNLLTASGEIEYSYCHTCGKAVGEGGEADVHRSIGHDVQTGDYKPSPLDSAPADPRNCVGRARAAHR